MNHRRVGWVAFLVFGACLWTPGTASDPDHCLLCHQYTGLSRYDVERDRVHLLSVDPTYHDLALGPHARLACTDCHERREVSVVPHDPVTRVDCTRQCHLSGPQGERRAFSHQGIASALEQSAHGLEAFTDLPTPILGLLEPSQSRCLFCHDEPMFRAPEDPLLAARLDSGEAMDRCHVCHEPQLSTDVRYFSRHVASRFQPARSSLEVAQVCATCHGDPVFRGWTGTPDTVASYLRSFHGRAALLGDERTANCVDCHAGRGRNAHELLGADDPRSSVHVDRVADSCTTLECHPGASPTIAHAAVHWDLPSARASLEFALAAAFILLTILTFGPSVVLVLLELFQGVVGRPVAHDRRVLELVERLSESRAGRRALVRFTPAQRVQHWILAILFVVLCLTGFPLKFADTRWAEFTIRSIGGLQFARTVHHWAGLALVVGFLGHLTYILVQVGRRSREPDESGRRRGVLKAVFELPMWITLSDARKAGELLAYYLFLRPTRPTFGRFSIKEKFEYIGVFWGTVLLGVTGVLLWGVHYSTHVVSGRALNLASIAHTYEAFLALIHVGILHIYGVMLSPTVFPLSPATITGRTPVQELVENHGEWVGQVAARVAAPDSPGAER